MAGRNPIYTPEIRKLLEEAIVTGMPYELAAEYAGISKSTLEKWKAGKFPKAVSAAEKDLFLRTIKRANARAVYEALNVIKGAMVGGLPHDARWQAAAWFLERRFPEHFGRRAVEVKATHTGAVEHNHLIAQYIAEIAAEEGIDPDELAKDASAGLGANFVA